MQEVFEKIIDKLEKEIIGNIFDNHELLKGEIKNEKI